MKESKKEKGGVVQRLREAETQKAEAQRAFNVAMAKIAHGAIEKIDRSRKIVGPVLSLISRIDSFTRFSTAYVGATQEILPSSQKNLAQLVIDFAHLLVGTYKSIREDVKSNLEIENFEELFPERPTYFETPEQTIIIIVGLAEQLESLKAYLLRYLS